MRTHRVVFCGDPNVGKSAVFDRLRGQDAPASYTPTVLARHFTFTNPELATAEVPHLNIWDVSGDRALLDEICAYFECVDIVVFFLESFTNQTLSSINQWRRLIQQTNANRISPSYIVVRTKIDENPVTSDEERLQRLIEREKHCPIVHISARTGEGVQELLQTLYDTCRDRVLHPPPVGVDLHGDRDGRCKC